MFMAHSATISDAWKKREVLVADSKKILEVRNLWKAFGSNRVLNGFDLLVEKGESVVVLGKSGSGKSVLIKCIIGLMKPDAGEINVLGQDVPSLSNESLDELRVQVGFLFQSNALYDSMTVRENLEFPLRRHWFKKTEAEVEALVQEALYNVGLSHTINMMPAELSGGMRKRVALARALINQPRCMLYDEPTAGLDPIVADSIDVLIRRLQRRLGVTSIVVTHDMKSAFAIADHVALLHEGRCYFYGTCDQLRASTDPVIRDFVEGRSHEEP